MSNVQPISLFKIIESDALLSVTTIIQFLCTPTQVSGLLIVLQIATLLPNLELCVCPINCACSFDREIHTQFVKIHNSCHICRSADPYYSWCFVSCDADQISLTPQSCVPVVSTNSSTSHCRMKSRELPSWRPIYGSHQLLRYFTPFLLLHCSVCWLRPK